MIGSKWNVQPDDDRPDAAERHMMECIHNYGVEKTVKALGTAILEITPGVKIGQVLRDLSVGAK